MSDMLLQLVEVELISTTRESLNAPSREYHQTAVGDGSRPTYNTSDKKPAAPRFE
ncbi:MAG TPA: hypothetical protein VL866_17380 [Pyrinomonadaceae bacterium]|nr:hypothetical protein [Pyrinomonadaceae bacterium]